MDINFIPHLVKGEGFYLAVVQKIGGETASLEPSTPKKKRKKNNKPPLPQIQTLSKTHKNIVQPWLKTPEEYALLEYKQNIYALPERLQLTATHWQTIFPYSPIGTAIGTIKGSDFIPSHELALSNLCSENIPTIELDKDNALIFLRKNIPTIPPNTPKGWVLVRYQGLNLGWIKVLSNRINNYLPKNWRILMRT